MNKMERPMRRQKKGESQGEHQDSKPLPMARNISNKEKGGPFERTPNLEEP
jgi:hypothetical protein